MGCENPERLRCMMSLHTQLKLQKILIKLQAMQSLSNQNKKV